MTSQCVFLEIGDVCTENSKNDFDSISSESLLNCKSALQGSIGRCRLEIFKHLVGHVTCFTVITVSVNMWTELRKTTKNKKQLGKMSFSFPLTIEDLHCLKPLKSCQISD